MKRVVKEVDGIVHIECSKCHELLPATLDYYVVDHKGKLGLKSWCKKCEKKRRESIKDEIKAYYQEKAEHFREYSRNYRKENPEKYKETKKKSYQKHRERYLKLKRQYHIENSDKELQYRIENKGKIKQKQKEYLAKYPDRRRKTVRKYRIKNRELYRKLSQKRRARVNSLIATFTDEDWEECLKYFDYKDAYTGLEMNSTSQDHVVPVSKGGSYVKSNIVPCDVNINASKGNSDLEEWYRKQPYFSEKRLNKIYKWIGYEKENNTQQLSIL